MRSDLLRTSALALAFVGSVGLAVAQQAPAQNNALVNGALAVPGAPANTDTVPAKFSVKNAADDKLITVAYIFKTLTDDERRAIYQALKDQRSSAFNADGGTEVPPGIELRPVPNNTAFAIARCECYFRTRSMMEAKAISVGMMRDRTNPPAVVLGRLDNADTSYLFRPLLQDGR